MGESFPGALIGLPEPTPFIAALFSYTAKMDRKEAPVLKAKTHEETVPVSAARKIKAMSLFPNIYRGPQYHRTFPKMRVDGEDGDNYYRKRDAEERRLD